MPDATRSPSCSRRSGPTCASCNAPTAADRRLCRMTARPRLCSLERAWILDIDADYIGTVHKSGRLLFRRSEQQSDIDQKDHRSSPAHDDGSNAHPARPVEGELLVEQIGREKQGRDAEPGGDIPRGEVSPAPRTIVTGSTYLREVTVPPEPIAEATCASHSIGNQSLTSIIPFLDQALAHTQSMALDGAAPIGTNADLRKLCDLARQLFRLGEGASLGGEIFAQADRQTFFGWHFPARENDLQGATLANDAGQPHCSPIDQWDTPAAAVDAKVGLLGHYPKIAP